jgi:hypothetical protein
MLVPRRHESGEGESMAITVASSGSHILPANERIYRTSNLLGEWNGSWNDRQVFSFKVVNIKNNQARIEYTHDGRKEAGNAIVDKNTITFGNVTIITRNGSSGVIQFKLGGFEKHTTILKAQDPVEDVATTLGRFA